MALPINTNELISGRTVEWERIEFKEGWNPQSILHSICAFANDLNNWGGGYIIIGIASINGRPVLPPVGLDIILIDSIQRELNQLCRRLLPNYFPIVEPVDFHGKMILILWCFGGSIRPYKAPENLTERSQYFYYIRRFSSTVRATRDDEYELISMSNQIPYDDRVNMKGTIQDFDLPVINSFLQDIKSDLIVAELQTDELVRKMNIAEGPDEYLLPKNAGLLFFGKNPQQFFPSAKIEVVRFSDEAGSEFTEKIFSGPLHHQLRSALNYIKDTIIEEKVIKRQEKAESDRYFNYPYQAIEEALVNAVYHRSYDDDSPIEVKIFPSHIEIISFPGPLPPLNKVNLQMFKFNVRKYRNRRIGEFLKEIHLTEGRGTGIPTILKELEKNGSPRPQFETDDARTYFLTSISIHSSFLPSAAEKYQDDKQRTKQVSVQVSAQVSAQVNLFILNNLDEILSLYDLYGEQVSVQVKRQVEEQVKKKKIDNLTAILNLCRIPQNRGKILSLIGLSNHYKNYTNNVALLVNNGLLEMTEPGKPNSRNQKYKLAEKGEKLLKIIL